MDRQEKREFVTELGQALSETSMIVVTRNTGLSVAEVTELRRRMRASGSTFKVAKNRLTNLALDGTPFDGIKPMLKGPTALAWSKDPVAVAKAAVEFARTNEKFVLIGGALGSRTLDADGIKALSEMPSLETLQKIAAALDLPLSQFFAEDPIKDTATVTLSSDEIRFLTQVQRYSANLTEADRRLLLVMVRKFAATASTSIA